MGKLEDLIEAYKDYLDRIYSEVTLLGGIDVSDYITYMEITRDQLPHLKNLLEKYKNRDLEVLKEITDYCIKTNSEKTMKKRIESVEKELESRKQATQEEIKNLDNELKEIEQEAELQKQELEKYLCAKERKREFEIFARQNIAQISYSQDTVNGFLKYVYKIKKLWDVFDTGVLYENNMYIEHFLAVLTPYIKPNGES